jgi:hypothetical protein
MVLNQLLFLGFPNLEELSLSYYFAILHFTSIETAQRLLGAMQHLNP